MNSTEKQLSRIFFKIKIHESNGIEFERLFTQIMNYREADFQQIKPWGNIGDRKCDGYVSSKGIFYQVYAPEEPKNSYPDIIKKLKQDFIGLLAQWKNVQEYYFVFNDKFLGVNADCTQVIEEIKQTHHLKNTGFVTAANLENILFQLADDQIQIIIGKIPDPANLSALDYSVVSEIVQVILSFSSSDTDGNIVVPDWNKKIQFNGLSEITKIRLDNGSLFLSQLDKYLDNHGSFLAEELRGKMSELYQIKKNTYENDELFWQIVNEIIPQKTKPFVESAIVIMAKYFETCDIFEEPPIS
ncbi:hypothetical protein FACS1894170_06160 [Planctomycetales bacterium]|nr:hypothetical protein FACS1894170_06160 [Planctomycetales bacterium]